MVLINGESVTNGVNSTPVSGNHLPAVNGAAGANIEEFSILTESSAGIFAKFPIAGSTSFAGIAGRKTKLEQGGTAGLYVQYDSLPRIVSGIYPVRIEKTAITANAEAIPAGTLMDASTVILGTMMTGVGNALARMVDRVDFEAATDAINSVTIAQVVLP